MATTITHALSRKQQGHGPKFFFRAFVLIMIASIIATLRFLLARINDKPLLSDNNKATNGRPIIMRGNSNNNNAIGGGNNNNDNAVPQKKEQPSFENDNADPNTVVLALHLDDGGAAASIDIRMRLLADKTPEAAAYLMELATEKAETCRRCTLYRGEPVPAYWGSEEYPDRYFDGGRWGPPYALVQGRFVADDPSARGLPIPPAESYRPPVVERGMVAWAGGKGGPDFFVALADHPEWGKGHTVFATVADEEGMVHLDALVRTRPLVNTKPKQPPIVSNFVAPISISISAPPTQKNS